MTLDRTDVNGDGGGGGLRETVGVRAAAVYCSSSGSIDPSYLALADEVGEALARSGRTVVYGGGKLGMMGRVSASARAAGGRVVGVITDRLRETEQMDPDNTENVVVPTMRERKALMEDRSDALVVLPGGVGTLEEFFEVFVGKLVGEHEKPIVVVNPPDPTNSGGGYYDPLLAMFEHMVSSRFVKRAVFELMDVVATADDAVAALDRRGAAMASGGAAIGDRRRFMPGLVDPAVEGGSP